MEIDLCRKAGSNFALLIAYPRVLSDVCAKLWITFYDRIFKRLTQRLWGDGISQTRLADTLPTAYQHIELGSVHTMYVDARRIGANVHCPSAYQAPRRMHRIYWTV